MATDYAKRLGVSDSTRLWANRTRLYLETINPTKPQIRRRQPTAMDREYKEVGNKAVPYTPREISYIPALTPNELKWVSMVKADKAEVAAAEAQSHDEMMKWLRIADDNLALAAKAEAFT